MLDSIAQGLHDNRIDPRKVIGGKEVGLQKWEQYDMQNQEFKSLSNEQIIAVQTMLIDKLAAQLKQKKN
jgi:hypothetical protein